jgi:hypothetical protein
VPTDRGPALPTKDSERADAGKRQMHVCIADRLSVHHPPACQHQQRTADSSSIPTSSTSSSTSPTLGQASARLAFAQVAQPSSSLGAVSAAAAGCWFAAAVTT